MITQSFQQFIDGIFIGKDYDRAVESGLVFVFIADVVLIDKGLVDSNNADYINLTINPNPLDNNELNFSINSERFMRFDVELVNSNGERLHGESLRMNANTEVRRTLSLDGMNLTNSLFLKVLFEDGSSVVLSMK